MSDKEKQKQAVLLYSGGQDSTTCLFWALKYDYDIVHVLGIDYGQRHQGEIQRAYEISEKVNEQPEYFNRVMWHDIDLDFMEENVGKESALTSKVQIEEKTKSGLPNTFVPVRNLLFLTIASQFAFCRGIEDIIIGVNAVDYSGYPDCREMFIGHFVNTVNSALTGNANADVIRVHYPLMWKNKSEIWEMAKGFGNWEFNIIKHETLTCYNGIVGDGCGECPACKLRQKGWEEFVNSQKEKNNSGKS